LGAQAGTPQPGHAERGVERSREEDQRDLHVFRERPSGAAGKPCACRGAKLDKPLQHPDELDHVVLHICRLGHRASVGADVDRS